MQSYNPTPSNRQDFSSVVAHSCLTVQDIEKGGWDIVRGKSWLSVDPGDEVRGQNFIRHYFAIGRGGELEVEEPRSELFRV